MINSSGCEKGMRKVRHAEKMAGYLLIGLVTSIVGHVFCKLPVEFFATYVLGIGGVTGSFAYGNSREHKFSQPSELTKPQG